MILTITYSFQCISCVQISMGQILCFSFATPFPSKPARLSGWSVLCTIWDPSQNLALHLLWLRSSFNEKVIVSSEISSLSSFRCLRWISYGSNNLITVFSVGKLVTEEKKCWIKMCFSLSWVQILHYWREWEFCQ